MITEAAPDTSPNATETETSHSARVTCRALVRPRSWDWAGNMRPDASWGTGPGTNLMAPRLAAAGALADFRL